MSYLHQFHIPVLGIGYSIDTPVKVARFGISSVISIMDDELLEKLRKYYCDQTGRVYHHIPRSEEDSRAKRISGYLDLVCDMITAQHADLITQPFGAGQEIDNYFLMLHDKSPLKTAYAQMTALEAGNDKSDLERALRSAMVAGQIDVNIMAKLDNVTAPGATGYFEYSDALSALRGYAKSKLRSSLVLSAGYNPRLYNYIEQFKDFFPEENGALNKKIILKVSDFRSASVQSKILAKKGIWVSEFRIESGLNCGGHAFATDGLLLGPILKDFRDNRAQLASNMYELCQAALTKKGINAFCSHPEMRITAQGGIGTAREQQFLMNYYEVDGTGWGSPFLLVPEATNVDEDTLHRLSIAEPDDYYLSHASPLGVPFNNFRKSSSQQLLTERMQKGRPGSPCYKKHLVSSTEFTTDAICTAARLYQKLKLSELALQGLPKDQLDAEMSSVTEKECICEGLGASLLLKNDMPLSHNLPAVAICPGPNLAYFSGVFTLAQMVGHIYGRENLLNKVTRPNMFINELRLYINYLKNELIVSEVNPKTQRYLQTFKTNLLDGIMYYKNIADDLCTSISDCKEQLLTQIRDAWDEVNAMGLQMVV